MSVLTTAVILLALPLVALADLDLPVVNGTVTSGVGWRVDPFGSGRLVFHRGTDIAVPVGTPVHATRKGRVVLAGEHPGHGATVIIEHDNGDRTLYGHNAILRARVGELVEAGKVIAFSGNTGRSTGPHVHYEKQPSGRPLTETVTSEERVVVQAAAGKQADDRRQRDRLEWKMEESVQSILNAIKNHGDAGQGG